MQDDETSRRTERLANRRQVYVRRRGRMTRGQERALTDLRDTYCIDTKQTTLADCFADLSADQTEPSPESVPEIGIEIGFGMGHATAHWALLRPDMRLLGIEVYEPGIGSLMASLKGQDICNVRIIEGDARVILEEWVPKGALSQINLFFPDPWPKKRHASRRIVQHDTVALYASRLAPGGTLRIATDWQPYAEWILECVDANPDLINMARGPGDERSEGYAERAPERPVTNFEARGLRLGHGVWDFWYERS